jgi:hypothetical protein
VKPEPVLQPLSGAGELRVSSKAKSALAATAYHEAGHALAHHLHGWGNGEVTIVPDKQRVGSARIADGARLHRMPRACFPGLPQAAEKRL